MNQDYEYLFKLILVGNHSADKSGLLLRFADSIFNETSLPTIGVDFRLRTLQIGSSIVKLQIWDTSGQQRFKTIMNSYYKGTHGILFVYNITDRQSFRDIEYWLAQADKYSNQSVVKLLIGNRSDLEANRQVKTEQGKAFADQLGIDFIETSHKDITNINKAFEMLATRIISKVQDYKKSRNSKDTQNDKNSKVQSKQTSSTFASAINFFKKPFINESQKLDNTIETNQLKKKIIELEDKLIREKKQKNEIIGSNQTIIKKLKDENKRLMKENVKLKIKLQKIAEKQLQLSEIFSQTNEKIDLCMKKMNLCKLQKK